jgi:hypothetical protein
MTLDISTSKFKINQKVKDDSFDIDALRQYALSIEVGMEGLRVCIIDTITSRCFWFEDYQFSAVSFAEHIINQLRLIYDDHHFLQAGYWQSVRVAFKNQHFTLLPHSLFQKEFAHQYLKLSTDSIKETEEVFSYRHPNNEIVSIFSGEKMVADFFREAYPARKVSFVHYTSALMEGVIQDASYSPTRQMSVLVEASYLTILITHNKQVEYCNTFFYLSHQDFIYYVMLVMDELKLNPDASKVTLYGELSHNSTIYNSLYKYIRNINFGSKPSTLRFGYQFDELLDHRYFDIFNVYLCD